MEISPTHKNILDIYKRQCTNKTNVKEIKQYITNNSDYLVREKDDLCDYCYRIIIREWMTEAYFLCPKCQNKDHKTIVPLGEMFLTFGQCHKCDCRRVINSQNSMCKDCVHAFNK